MSTNLNEFSEREPIWSVSLLKSVAPVRWSCVIGLNWPVSREVYAEDDTPQGALDLAMRRIKLGEEEEGSWD